MSKIALTPNASGSGTFTIAAPNSDTDRTLTLPDSAGTIATTNGITEVDVWALTANFTGSGYLSSNLARDNTTGFSKLGTGVSESSGIFTFPSTGLWKIEYSAVFSDNTSTTARYGMPSIATTTDNSTYTRAARSLDGVYNSDGSDVDYGSGFCTAIFNVTDTANCKVRFEFFNPFSLQLAGESGDQNQTVFVFMRLGDAQ